MTNKERDAVLYAVTGRSEKLVSLLENGVSLDAADEAGSTLLMLAAGKGHKAIVELLLRRGANVQIKSKGGQKAYNYAIANGYTDIAAMLENLTDFSVGYNIAEILAIK